MGCIILSYLLRIAKHLEALVNVSSLAAAVALEEEGIQNNRNCLFPKTHANSRPRRIKK